MFDYEASVQAVDYIIKKLNPDSLSLDKITILKMLFFAERYSIRKFAQTITGDRFVAMKFGPVASSTYDILKFKDYANGIEYAREALESDGSINVHSKSIFLVRDDYDALSDTDLEALNFAIDTFGVYSPLKLSNITHRYREWAKFESDILSTNGAYDMDMSDFFIPTTDDTKEYSLIDDERVKLSKELYDEMPFSR